VEAGSGCFALYWNYILLHLFASRAWWNKGRSHTNIPIARTINSASGPLLITDLWVYSVDKIGNLLGLSYLINSQAKFLVWLLKIVEISQKFNEIFLYGIPSG